MNALGGSDSDGLSKVVLLGLLECVEAAVVDHAACMAVHMAVLVRGAVAAETLEINLMERTRLVAVGAQSVKLRALEPGLMVLKPVTREWTLKPVRVGPMSFRRGGQ